MHVFVLSGRTHEQHLATVQVGEHLQLGSRRKALRHALAGALDVPQGVEPARDRNVALFFAEDYGPDIPHSRKRLHVDQVEQCFFTVVIEKYAMRDKALLRLARIVSAADTNRLADDPIATGFEAIAVGYNLRFPDDQENLRRQFEVYDALYAWCRLEVAKQEGQ